MIAAPGYGCFHSIGSQYHGGCSHAQVGFTSLRPGPPPKEVAKSLGISKRRQREINAMAEELIRQLRGERESRREPQAVEPEKRRKRASAA